MLTLPDSHIEQLGQAELRPIVLVRIDLDSPASRYFCAVSGGERRFGYPNNIDTVTPIQRRLDREARTVTIGQMTVTLADDGWLRDLAQRYFLPNKLVTLSLGFPDDAEADFQPFYKGIIFDIIPRDRVKMDLVCKDAGTSLASAKVAGHWTAMHPLEVIADLVRNYAGIPVELIDYDSLDPSLYPRISHFSVTRAGKDASKPWFNKEISQESKSSALDLVNELLLLVDGVLVPDEHGVLTFRLFDSGAATVDSWTSDDIAGLEVLSTWGDSIKNEVVVTMDGTESDSRGNNRPAAYKGEDLTAKALLAMPGRTYEARTLEVATQWLNGVYIYGAYSGAVFSATDVTIGTVSSNAATNPSAPTVFGLLPTPQQLGFCGGSITTVDRDGHVAQESWRQLSSGDGRYAYWLLGHEIVRMKEPVSFTGPASSTDDYNDRWAAYATYTIDGRELFGTRRGGGATITDITVPVYIAQAFLNRLAYGLAKLRVWTTLTKRAAQLGDFVSVVDPIPVLYGSAVDGVDAATAWEITAKDEDPLGDTPGIWWELTFVRTTTANVSVVTTTVYPEQRVNTFTDALIDRASGEMIIDRDTGTFIYRR